MSFDGYFLPSSSLQCTWLPYLNSLGVVRLCLRIKWHCSKSIAGIFTIVFGEMFSSSASSLLAFLLASLSTFAAPVVQRVQGITALPSWQVAEFSPYSHFAAAAYCDPSVALNWTCGGKLLALFFQYIRTFI
jgi:hypothetical protein